MVLMVRDSDPCFPTTTKQTEAAIHSAILIQILSTHNWRLVYKKMNDNIVNHRCKIFHHRRSFNCRIQTFLTCGLYFVLAPYLHPHPFHHPVQWRCMAFTEILMAGLGVLVPGE